MYMKQYMKMFKQQNLNLIFDFKNELKFKNLMKTLKI